MKMEQGRNKDQVCHNIVIILSILVSVLSILLDNSQ